MTKYVPVMLVAINPNISTNVMDLDRRTVVFQIKKEMEYESFQEE